MILGKKELVEACRKNGSPNSAIGRVAKVGKEEIMGLLTAVERYMKLDHAKILQDQEQWTTYLIEYLAGLPEIQVTRVYPGMHGQTYLSVCITFHDRENRDKVVQILKEGDPCIIVGVLRHDERSFYINPVILSWGEVLIIADKLKAAITAGLLQNKEKE